MSYKKLGDFREILGRDDFNRISDPIAIKNFFPIITYNVRNPSRDDDRCKRQAEQYRSDIRSFFEWFGKGIPEAALGCQKVHDVMNWTVSMLGMKELERASISGGYANKQKKTFIFGLSRLHEGLTRAFESSNVQHTKITGGQIARFIIDRNIGLGRMYQFNAIGRYAIGSRLRNPKELTYGEIINTLRLLELGYKKRTHHKWIDFGDSSTPVRILAASSIIGRDKVYFLLKTNGEHDIYDRFMDSEPNKSEFRALD